MRHAVLHDLVRVVVVGLGLFSLGVAVLLTASFWTCWRTTDGAVEAHEALVRGEKTQVLRVSYTRANGVMTSVPFPEETLASDARAGDRVTVAYMPSSKSAIVCTFRSVWRVPTLTAGFGIVTVFVGLYFGPRRRVATGQVQHGV